MRMSDSTHLGFKYIVQATEEKKHIIESTTSHHRVLIYLHVVLKEAC